jgi:AcrR family transcriptional regulator
MARPADPKRRDNILHAAREVFLEYGYTDARLSDIAKRAGIVVSTLYLYFASKEEMVQELGHKIHIEVAIATLPILKTFKNKEDLRHFVHVVLFFARDNEDLLRLYMLDKGLQSVRVNRNQLPRGHYFQEMCQTLAQRIEQGAIRRYDPVILLDILIGFQRWIFEMYPILSEEDLPRYEAMFVEWLANALLPNPISTE